MMDELHKRWLDHRNKKNLIKRTKHKNRKRFNDTKKIEYNKHAKLSLDYNQINKSHVFAPPSRFSFVKNAEDTTEFFNKVIKFIADKRNYDKRIFFDISKISGLTIDALMYLLAIVNNVKKKFKNKYIFTGNFPDDYGIKTLLSQSGFLNYLKCNNMDRIVRSDSCLEIRSGNVVDKKTAKEICDFAIKQGKIPKSQISFLYCMIMELMENTKQHAYTHKSPLVHYWYIFAERKSNVIQFSFIDTGEGIPHTVYKKLYEKLNMAKDDSSYILSALSGEFRTRTQQKNRGNGLPKIYEHNQLGKIQNLQIISGKGTYRINNQETGSDLLNQLQGTLFYWEISLDPSEGDCICQ